MPTANGTWLSYTAGGDEGRVAVGTASGTDILLSKKR